VDETSLNSPESPLSAGAPTYWRSLEEREELAQGVPDPGEFAPGADLPPTGLSRRGFLGLLGATAALATSAACDRKSKQLAVPYTKRPESGVPGVADYYASSFQEGPRSYSVLVKTREGRPIHITGNDEHPHAKGATSPRAIAQVLALYDPDRLREPRLDGRKASWKEAEDRLAQGLATSSVLLLTGSVISPSRQALLRDFKARVPALQHLAWEPTAGAREEASIQALGAPFHSIPRLDKAQVILSLGADFLSGEDPGAIAAFTRARNQEVHPGAMNRLWVFEGPLSLTGSRADHRFPLPASKAAALAFALARDLHEKHGVALPAGAELPARQILDIPAQTWAALLADLAQAKSRAVVLCGPELPVEAQLGVHLLNAMLKTEALEYLPAFPTATAKEMEAAVQAMAGGKVRAVILWGVNPAHAYPDQKALRQGLEKVPLRAWIGQREDETSALCQVLLPEHHWLEAWGDYQEAGALTLQQPAIGALYDTRQGEDILLDLLRGLGATVPADYHTYLKTRWEREVQPKGSLVPFERYFQVALHDGLIHTTQPVAPAFRGASCKGVGGGSEASGFELLLHPGRAVFDGRWANNGWLQELPDPVTKATWGNPLSVSVTDARILELKDGDMVDLEAGAIRYRLPVLVQPGQAKGVLSLALGYGHEKGSVAAGVGTNAYPLVQLDARNPFTRSGVKLTKARGSQDLSITQGHHRMEGRDLVRSTTLAQLARGGGPVAEDPATLYPEKVHGEHQWGMVIDLATCVGCSGCVVACQSENNTPVVGPEQVAKGREMHWIRVDRYYEGEPENPSVVHQPMMCQQCDHAPCENVCPVNATTHSPDGLNQMTYNRCVGTRYCANNCPYKVRRFNFLEFTATKQEPESLVYNPEVTVRPRGVMEKCTFCVQRIQDGRMRAKGENRPLKDGEIQPACAAACPSEAIVFGDLKDPKSRVSKLARSGRGYKVLGELGVRPAITYLSDVRNPAGGGHES